MIRKYTYRLLCFGLLAISMTGCLQKQKKLNKHVSLWRKDKIPYGTLYAFNNIKYIFPEAGIKLNDKSPASYNFERLTFQDGANKGRTAYIVISPHIFPDRSEINALSQFVAGGNQIFMSSYRFGDSLLNYLKIKLGPRKIMMLDSGLQVSVMDPVKYDSLPFQYPGFGGDNYVDSLDSKYATILGRDDQGRPDFIKFSYKGGGAIFLHFAPLAFSNFFLLHKNNKVYYDEAFSQMSPLVNRVIWDDYFRRSQESQFSALRFILSNPSLRWAVWLVLLLFLIVYLFESKRRQKWIPVIEVPRNSSLDFVKTIGRLYYQQKDNSNLVSKMVSHFADYVRNKYNLSSPVLDEEFADRLSYKSGFDQKQMRLMIQELHSFSQVKQPSDIQLIHLNKKLEEFYKLA